MIKYRAHNGYDTLQASDDAAYTETMPSLAVQDQKDDADINVLMKRMNITGKMPNNPKIPTYGDFTQVRDFRSALESVREAQEAFMTIPAEIRFRFQNDPQTYLEFCSDPKNLPEMRKLGLAKPEAPPPEPPKPVEPPKPGST